MNLTRRLFRPASDGSFFVNQAQLDQVLAGLNQVQERGFALGVTLGQPTAADVLLQRGVVVSSPVVAGEEGLLPALLADLDRLLDAFIAEREREGRALGAVLTDQLATIAVLTEQATAVAKERRPDARAALIAALRRVADSVPGVGEDRIAQELALLAVKGDVTEEIDRLRAHIAGAKEIHADTKPVGRRLDFLMQEFNREANTLLSKSSSAALSRVGLDLKTAIDQMREQAQSVE